MNSAHDAVQVIRDALSVAGECPWGCGRTLFLANGGYVTCSWHACPNPDTLGSFKTRLTEALAERDAAVNALLVERDRGEEADGWDDAAIAMRAMARMREVEEELAAERVKRDDGQILHGR